MLPTKSAIPVESSDPPIDETGPRADTSARVALLVFAAVEVAALITILVLGRHQWFTSDEWDFLADRNAGSIVDLFRPHNGHWSTLPILVYRGLFNVFGLNTYLPYQLVLVLLDLTTAALLRTVMRRAGVSPWIATAAASLFVLFGAGYEDMIWAFQIGFVGSLVFGLTQLLLADHDGPVTRRDYLALLAGVAGLMCSGIAIPMTVAVGLAMWLRRSWRIALMQTVPLAAIYAIWWYGIGRTYYHGPGIRGNLSGLARWVEIGIRSSFEAMGQLTGVGIVLGALLVVGLWVAWHGADRKELGIRAAAPGALLIGGVVFFVVTGLGRDAVFGPSFASRSRYLQIFTALALPAIAVAADALARRWRHFLPVALVLLVIGIPGNLWDLGHTTGLWDPILQTEYRYTILTLPSVPVAHEVPRSTSITDLTGLFSPAPAPEDVTLGWLLDQKAAGRLPSPGPLDPRWAADATLYLDLSSQSIATSGSVAIGSAGPSPAAQGGESTSGASGVSTPTTPLVRISNSPKDGPILVDSAGMALYTLTNGYHPLPCTGACAGIWRPLLAPPGSAAPTGGPGVSGLGRSSSGTVVTYFGLPAVSRPS